MINQERFEIPRIAAPSEPHIACMLLLDTSGSMAGEPIDSLNQALRDFKEKVSIDEKAKNRVDIAIIEFNHAARLVQDFIPIFSMKPVQLTAGGCTSMGAGINMAIDKMKERNRFYALMGIPVFKPWIFMITAGAPTDDIKGATMRIREEENKGANGKLKFFALGIPGYEKSILFNLTKRLIELRNTDFYGIFDWLSKNMVSISMSTVGDEAPLSLLPDNARKVDPSKDVIYW